MIQPATETFLQPAEAFCAATRLSYLQIGAGDRAIVLVHGFGGSKEIWWSTLLALAPLGRVFAPDLPGHGGSPLHGDWRMPRIAARIADFCAVRGLPAIALVGHSMGGRAAVYAAGHESVRAVVGLAPWLERDDPVDTVAGREVLVAHGVHDRVTSPKASLSWVRRAGGAAASVSFVSVQGDGHAMLRRAPVWHALATRYVLAMLCDVPPPAAHRSAGTHVIAKVLAGNGSLVV